MYTFRFDITFHKEQCNSEPILTKREYKWGLDELNEGGTIAEEC